MGRPRTDPDRRATRDRLLSAATIVFADVGFARSRLADIAEAAGIRRSSLLYHFESKAALYAAVVARTFDGLTAELAGAMDRPGPFPDRVEAMVRRFEGYLHRHPHDARLVVRQMIASDGPGQVILVEAVGPLLALVVDFLEAHGADHLRPGLPLGAAVLQIASDALLQTAATDPLRDALWGAADLDRSWGLARTLLLRREA